MTLFSFIVQVYYVPSILQFWFLNTQNDNMNEELDGLAVSAIRRSIADVKQR
jgi:hypothetical protein